MRLGIRSAMPFVLPTAQTVKDTAGRVLHWTAIVTAVVVTTGAVVAASFVTVVLNLS